MVGAAAGFPKPDFGGAILMNFAKSLTISMRSLDSVRPEALGVALVEIFDLVAKGQLKAVIGKTVSFEQLGEGHAALEGSECSESWSRRLKDRTQTR